MFISEKSIDKVFDFEVDSDDIAFDELKLLAQSQPSVLDFLTQESFELLTAEEYDFLIFLSLVIWKSYIATGHQFIDIPPQAFEEAEERNWSIMNEAPNGHFNKRINQFFEDFPQEDLLAFVEDALTEEEMGIITKEGREPMFVSLKTLIDVLESHLA